MAEAPTATRTAAKDGAKAKTSPKTYLTRNDLPADVRGPMIDLLNQQLANLFDLHSQTKHAHWNVKGPQFIGLHKLFDELAEVVEEQADEVAERATALGGIAQGTARRAAAASELPEFEDNFAAMRVVETMAERFAAAGKSARQGIDQADDAGDADTADLLTQVSRALDKSLYFLEAHLQEPTR